MKVDICDWFRENKAILESLAIPHGSEFEMTEEQLFELIRKVFQHGLNVQIRRYKEYVDEGEADLTPTGWVFKGKWVEGVSLGISKSGFGQK